MKKILIYSGLVALVVSALSIGIFTILQEEGKTIKIEHINSSPSSKVLYTSNNEGDLIPLDFTKTAEKVMDVGLIHDNGH